MASTKLYVGNLSRDASQKEIKEVFAAFGELDEVAVLDGFAFVHFVNADDASAALDALDNSELCGQKLLVQYSRTKGHGYGRGSGPPIPRSDWSRGRSHSHRPPPQMLSYRPDYDRYSRYDRYGYRDSYRDPYYSRPSYRDLYARDSYRDGYPSTYRDRYRDREDRYDRDRDYGYSRDRSRERDRDRY